MTFAIPQGSVDDHPRWENAFRWQFISDAPDSQYYTDIATATRPINLQFEAPGWCRNLYLAKSHDFCDNDRIWFSVLNNKGCKTIQSSKKIKTEISQEKITVIIELQ